jgi:hypothetical protein
VAGRPVGRRQRSPAPRAPAIPVRGPEADDVHLHATYKDLIVLTELIEAGKLTSVIDRTYPLSEAPKAIRYLEQGHGVLVAGVPQVVEVGSGQAACPRCVGPAVPD